MAVDQCVAHDVADGEAQAVGPTLDGHVGVGVDRDVRVAIPTRLVGDHSVDQLGQVERLEPRRIGQFRVVRARTAASEAAIRSSWRRAVSIVDVSSASSIRPDRRCRDS